MTDGILTRPDHRESIRSAACPTGAAPGRPVVIATLLRQRGRTGVETHVRTADAHLRSVARDSTVLTPFSARNPLLYPIFALRHLLDRINTAYGVWWYRAGHVLFLRQALRRCLAGTPDAVVYAQCPGSAAAALKVRTTQPVVLVAHFNISEGDEFAQSGLIKSGGRLHRAIRAFEADVLPRLDGIIYVSEHTRAVVEERLPATKALPSRTIHNSVPMIDRGPVARTGDLITVGALERRKNHSYLLEVLAAARRRGHRYTLSIVGDGPERPRLERLVHEVGVADQVRFHGFQSDPRALMAGHSLYCHTATTESFGLVVIEAMAERLPVLAGRVGGIAEILRPGLDGDFWPLDDAETAATILIERMTDPGTLADRSAHAAARAREAFSTQAQGARLLDFLDEATVRHPSATEVAAPPVPPTATGGRAQTRRSRAALRLLDKRLPWVVTALLHAIRLLPPERVRRIPITGARMVALVALDLAVQRYPKDFLCTSAHGALIRGNTRDLVQRWIYVFGVWEPDLTAWLRGRLSPGATVVDVGANVGYYTTLAANAVGPDGTVVAIECLPSTAKILRDNIALNQLDNVAVHALAVGEEAGAAPVYSGGVDNTGAASTNGHGVAEATVPVQTLDEILRAHPAERISFIKIDVEGDELKVLRGARRTLQALQPGAAVLVEVDPKASAGEGGDTDPLPEILPASRFDAYVVDNIYTARRYADSRVRPPRRWTGTLDRKIDLLFVKK